MVISVIARISVWSWRTTLADMVRNPEPPRGERGFDPLLESEIQRLAALSPHLLDDIGITESNCDDVVTAFASRARHNRISTPH